MIGPETSSNRVRLSSLAFGIGGSMKEVELMTEMPGPER